MVAAHHIMGSWTKGIVTIGMQNESELLLLDDDLFGTQDNRDAGVAAASPAGEFYESEEPSSDEDTPAARQVLTLVHL